MTAVAAAVVLAVVAVAGPLGLPGFLPGIGGPGPSAPSSSPDLVWIEYEVVPLDGKAPTTTDIRAVAEVMTERLAAGGFSTLAPEVTVTPAGRVLVQLDVSLVSQPYPDSVEDAVRRLLGTTGQLDFVPLGQEAVAVGDAIDPARFPALFSGDQVAEAKPADDGSGILTMDFTLRPDGAELFAVHTAAHVGEYFAVVLDGQVLTAPMIQSPIPDGKVQISSGVGGWSAEAARSLVALVASGPLPHPVQEVANGQGTPDAGGTPPASP